MKVPHGVLVSLTTAAVLLFLLVLVTLPATEARETFALDARATVTEEVVIDGEGVRISLPAVEGLGAELDSDINARIADIAGLDNLIDFIAKQQQNGGAFDARMRYKALRTGYVFRLSIATFVYAGGAHGEEHRYEIYVDSRTGEFYELRDLFTKRRADRAMKAIGEYIEGIMGGQDIGFFDGASPLPLPDLFIIDREGLRIIYPPLSIAPYGEGFLTYEIPLAVYEKYIDKNGSFYKALMGPDVSPTSARVGDYGALPQAPQTL